MEVSKSMGDSAARYANGESAIKGSKYVVGRGGRVYSKGNGRNAAAGASHDVADGPAHDADA
ncbi:hypothetical protein D3C71_2179540 [compost metagenome]